MREGFPGYRGEALRILKKVGAEIGDIIRITKDAENYEGILIPRSEYGDEEHIMIKIKSGYNIGISITPMTRIKKIGTGIKPKFMSPPLPKQKKGLPRVAIVSTGGTIASRVDYRTGGVRPALTANDLYSVFPEISKIALVEANILLTLFSEHITAEHWSEIAKTVAKHIKKGVAGVVVAHGTDTMGYTAAALSFALQNLSVPVIIVGSQRSSDRPSSDAATNLVGAVNAAANAPFAEVALAMHKTVSDKSIVFHRGTKVRKCHTSRRDAFMSINTAPLARMENDELIMLTADYLERNPKRRLTLKPFFDEKVALIKFHPGMNPKVIEWYVDEGYNGIVLEGTGLGHIGKYCFSAVQKAIEKEVIVAMTSQCIWGRLNMNIYDTGRDLLAMGVIPLEDMLPETAFVKLMWILGSFKPRDIYEVRRLMLTNFAGEVNPRTIFTDSTKT